VALGDQISGRDLILISGGLFRLAKRTFEIHDKLEREAGHASARVGANFAEVVIQIMLFACRPVGEFVHERPTLKILALSSLLLIAVSPVAEGLEFAIPMGYIYFAMGFSVFVEMLTLWLRERAAQPLKLRERYTP